MAHSLFMHLFGTLLITLKSRDLPKKQIMSCKSSCISEYNFQQVMRGLFFFTKGSGDIMISMLEEVWCLFLWLLRPFSGVECERRHVCMQFITNWQFPQKKHNTQNNITTIHYMHVLVVVCRFLLPQEDIASILFLDRNSFSLKCKERFFLKKDISTWNNSLNPWDS